MSWLGSVRPRIASPRGGLMDGAEKSLRLKEARRKAWETRRAAYGRKGYGPTAYGRGGVRQDDLEAIRARQRGRHLHGPQPGQESVRTMAFLVARNDIDALLAGVEALRPHEIVTVMLRGYLDVLGPAAFVAEATLLLKTLEGEADGQQVY